MYMIELGVCGYTDNPKNKTPLKEKLKLLKEQNLYWKEMRWKKYCDSI